MKSFIGLCLLLTVGFAEAHTLTCWMEIHDKDGDIIETIRINEKITEVMAPGILTHEKLYKSSKGRFEFYANIRVWEDKSQPYQLQIDVYDSLKDVQTSFHADSDFLNGVQMDGKDTLWNRKSSGYAFHCDFWATQFE